MSVEQSIRYWSTQAVSPAMRIDYWMSVLRTSLWPVTEWTELPRIFSVELQEAPLGCLSSMTEDISAHIAHRTRTDVDRSQDRSYHLFANFEPWAFDHYGRHGSLESGDLVLLAEGEHTTCAPTGFKGVILKCPADWMQSWLPDPEVLVGRRIAKDSRWGRVLSPMVSQLTPEVAAAPPLPHSVLVDQLGAVLGLIAGEAEASAAPEMLRRIQECIRERCTEPQLSAADVAASVTIPPQALHRILAGRKLTFASQLLDARVEVALQMLGSPSFRQLTMAEIALRAGFVSAAYFSRVVRKRTGHTPLELRRHARS
jgi:AraC-like DNA-binding protein